MARKKQYNEEEVIEKATDLFWRNGYEATTVRMLEKEMGINQFSIYSSFGNKQGVFLQCLDTYKRRIRSITHKLENSKNGLKGIERFFYDFLEFVREDKSFKGCLVTNTVNELKEDTDPLLRDELGQFVIHMKRLFVNNLSQDPDKTPELIDKQGDYLLNCLLGLSVSSKLYDQQKLKGIIEITFMNL